jgi:hypothetical protein
MVSALTTVKSYFIDIALIYWEDLANLRATYTIAETSSWFCKHRAGEKQAATGAALMATTFTDKQLTSYIPPSQMNQSKTPDLASGVMHKAGVFSRLSQRTRHAIEKKSKTRGSAKPSAHTMDKQVHICSFEKLLIYLLGNHFQQHLGTHSRLKSRHSTIHQAERLLSRRRQTVLASAPI